MAPDGEPGSSMSAWDEALALIDSTIGLSEFSPPKVEKPPTKPQAPPQPDPATLPAAKQQRPEAAVAAVAAPSDDALNDQHAVEEAQFGWAPDSVDALNDQHAVEEAQFGWAPDSVGTVKGTSTASNSLLPSPADPHKLTFSDRRALFDARQADSSAATELTPVPGTSPASSHEAASGRALAEVEQRRVATELTPSPGTSPASTHEAAPAKAPVEAEQRRVRDRLAKEQLEELEQRRCQLELKALGLKEQVMKNDRELCKLRAAAENSVKTRRKLVSPAVGPAHPLSPSCSSSSSPHRPGHEGNAKLAPDVTASRVAEFRTATARSDDFDVSVQEFWERHPDAVHMLDNAIEAWTGTKGTKGASAAKDCARECATAFGAPSAVEEVVSGGSLDERDTLWARVLLGQEAKIEWLVADNAMRQRRLGLQDRLPDLGMCPVGQRELRLLFEESTSQQELIYHLLTAPPEPHSPSPLTSDQEFGGAPSNASPCSVHADLDVRTVADLPRSPSQRSRSAWSASSRSCSPSKATSSPQRSSTSPQDRHGRSDILAGLRSAFLRGGLTVRTPEALAWMQGDVADVIGVLLEEAWRLRRRCRARHASALEAAQRARLNAACVHCERLVHENAKLAGGLEASGERQQALMADRHLMAASFALRSQSAVARASGVATVGALGIARLAPPCTPLKPSLQRLAADTGSRNGKPWSPAGQASPSHHVPGGSPLVMPSASTGSCGKCGGTGVTTGSTTSASLAPWWASRAAKRAAPAPNSQSLRSRASEEDCFDAYSVHHPGLAGPALLRIAAPGSLSLRLGL